MKNIIYLCLLAMLVAACKKEGATAATTSALSYEGLTFRVCSEILF